MKGMYLRTLRERAGLTQDQLARLSQVAQNTISKLESNPNARPVFATVVSLATAFRVDPMALRFGPDPRQARRRAPRAIAPKDEASA